MNAYQKVAWSEGMFLRPQHFQQQERYFEFFSHSRGMAAEPYFWGLRNLQLDVSALAIGKFAVTEAEGLLPDGTPFAFPLQCDCPEPLDFAEGVIEQRIFLALPLRRPGTEEVLFEERPRSLARYWVNDALVGDINSEAGEDAELQLAVPRMRLMLERDMTDAWLGVGIARLIECRGDRQVVVDKQYYPALVSCHACPAVAALVQEAHGLVCQRADLLAERLAQPGRGGVSEVAEFLLLQLLNRNQPILAHFGGAPGFHPERLYSVLVQLVSELATFTSKNRRPDEWPQYNHDDLYSCLSPLMMTLRSALSSVLEQNAFQIELQERNHGIRIGQIADGELLEGAQFILAVHSSLPTDALRSRFKSQVKLGPADRIRDLVNLHMPGISLRALPIAPRQIPYNAGYHYFEIDTAHELWGQLKKSQALALHIAGDFPDLQLECWAIRR